MQPSPMAETSRPAPPSLRFCIKVSPPLVQYKTFDNGSDYES
jgi:hypothetical protein